MGYMYTKDKLEKMYKEGNYFIGEWSQNGSLYLEKYEEYIQWIVDYEQKWGNVEKRYHVLFDSPRKGIVIVRGNFVVGELYANGDIKNVWPHHLLDKKDIKAKKTMSPAEVEPEIVSCDKDLLSKIEQDLAAIMQRIESSFMVPSNFFEKN